VSAAKKKRRPRQVRAKTITALNPVWRAVEKLRSDAALTSRDRDRIARVLVGVFRRYLAATPPAVVRTGRPRDLTLGHAVAAVMKTLGITRPVALRWIVDDVAGVPLDRRADEIERLRKAHDRFRHFGLGVPYATADATIAALAAYRAKFRRG